MNKSEIEIRYRAKVRFWWEKFESISNEISELSSQKEQLQIKLQDFTKRLDKITNENLKIIIELRKLQEEKEEMSFNNIALEKQ